MSIVKIRTNFNIDLEFEVPEFYRRILAWIIDTIILFFYLKIASYFLAEYYGRFNPDDDYNVNFIEILLWAPVFIYHPICEITMNGKSLGKMLTGLQVVNETGGQPSISQYLIRWLVRTADIMVILIILYRVYIILNPKLLWAVIGSVLLLITDVGLIISTRKGQRLGDILARTIIISTKARGSISETVFQEVADDYVPSFPQIMQLSDRDINAIKAILEAARKRSDGGMALSAAERIKAHLHIQSSLASDDFLDVLLKDYNYLSTK